MSDALEESENRKTGRTSIVPESFPVFYVEDLKKLDQCLSEVVNTIRSDPGRTDDYTGNDFKNAVGKVDELLNIQFQFEMKFPIFQESIHLWVLLSPAPLHPDCGRNVDAQRSQTICRKTI